MDADGNPVPPGTVGELVTRGPYLMEGYFGDEEETARYFPRRLGLDGRSRQGRRRRLRHARGPVPRDHHLGRLQHPPSEVETALARHPAVQDCTVFGVPDERWGEAPVAYIVPAADVSADELIAHCTDRLARYKRPREIVFVDTIPAPLRQGPKTPPPQRLPQDVTTGDRRSSDRHSGAPRRARRNPTPPHGATPGTAGLQTRTAGPRPAEGATPPTSASCSSPTADSTATTPRTGPPPTRTAG